MQEYGGGTSNKSGEYRESNAESNGRERNIHSTENYQTSHQFSLNQQKNYVCSNKELSDQNMATYCRVATSIYEATNNQQCQNLRYNNPSAPTFSSPPNSPLVGLVFDPNSTNYSGMIGDRNSNSDKRNQCSWAACNQEPIGTGAKKKIVKSQDKRNMYNTETRYQERYKDNNDTSRHRKLERKLTSESTTSLDFYVEGERMVSELCNISDQNLKTDSNNDKCNNQEEDKTKSSVISQVLLTALDKMVIHDQIPNQIVQLAIEACTDAENIAIAHHNRPCFKNIHSICAKTRSNVQKPDSAVANLHSQGIPWVIKNFIFSFVRILDGWKGVKELLSEKHDTFSRIENKYYSPNIRECFVQWQAVTKEMLMHIYKTFKCLDHGFTMEQKSFTHNYYATNSAAPRHQNQNKFQAAKPHVSTPRPVNASSPHFNAIQPPWLQNPTPTPSQCYNESPWSSRSGAPYKKYPVSQNVYTVSEQSDIDNYSKISYKCDPCNLREAKPRQSWTITNVPDIRVLENMCQADQRELYNQLKHKMDAELSKTSGQPLIGTSPCDYMQRRDMDIKAKMIPLSHVEKSLIPSMATPSDMRGCYVQKNNSCGDTKEEIDFFAAWGQMVQKESSDFLTYHTHNIPVPSNVVTLTNNTSGPVHYLDTENDEFHEMSKVYMKPGSYKVPIKPTDPSSTFIPAGLQDIIYDSSVADEMTALKMKPSFPQAMFTPQPKYDLESWPGLISRQTEETFDDEQKLIQRTPIPCLSMRTPDSLDILGSMPSDRAWEAAKLSAPKLMDIIHEGSKSDTARLYNALGLSANDEYTDDGKQMKLRQETNEPWPGLSTTSHFVSKDLPNFWDQQSQNHGQLFSEDSARAMNTEGNARVPDDLIESYIGKSEETKENACPVFDQGGNFMRDDSQKKSNGKSKITTSGVWYHPKKKKPLPTPIVNKFETILHNLSQINEASFIQQDMDMKVAPRFYEVVKYPMCLQDISTKLKNSSYTEYEQVVQDFKRIFNNVRLYLKSYPDPTMKKNVNKVSADFEKMLNEEFKKGEGKPKSVDTEVNDPNKEEGDVTPDSEINKELKTTNNEKK